MMSGRTMKSSERAVVENLKEEVPVTANSGTIKLFSKTKISENAQKSEVISKISNSSCENFSLLNSISKTVSTSAGSSTSSFNQEQNFAIMKTLNHEPKFFLLS
jgi:DsbC/DsbD-like thiol-disulfide interchange protein